MDCAQKIYRYEGGIAFWKGTGAHVCRSSPQFGVTLATYELLNRLLHIDFGKSTPPTSKRLSNDLSPHKDPDMIGGFRVAHRCVAGMESRYGLVFTKSSPSQVTGSTQKT